MRQKKRIFSAILAVIMVFTLLPLSAFAAESEVSDFSELQTAISDGEDIKLMASFEATAAIIFPSSYNGTLDLNGFTLSGSLGAHMITNNGTLTIKDDSAEGTGKIEKTNATNQYLIDNSGTMTIEGGTFVSASNGSTLLRTNVNCETTIENGTFESVFITLKVEETGTLIIEDGTFTASRNGASVVQNWGETTINGGTFTATGTGGTAIYAGSWEGDASTTTINDGTFEADYVIFIDLEEADDDSIVTTIDVQGGTFTGAVNVGWQGPGALAYTLPASLYAFTVEFQHDDGSTTVTFFTDADIDEDFLVDVDGTEVFDGWTFDGGSEAHKTLTEALFDELVAAYTAGTLIEATPVFHTISTDAGIDSITVAGVAATEDSSDSSGHTYEVTIAIPDGTTITTADFEVETTDAHATVGTATYDTTDEVWEIVVTAEDGSTTKTYKVTVTTKHTPAAPTGVAATAGNGQITVTWAAPSDVGDSAITGYEIVVNNGTPISVGDVTTHTLTGLTNGTSYSITVAAVNNEGTGAASTAVSATPVAPSTGGGSGGGTPSAKPEEKPADEPEDEPEASVFTDVSEDVWYAESVAFVNENGLMTGTGNGTFSPDTNMTRAMLATVLHRLAGEPVAASGASFSDIASGTWYSDAIAWAQTDGIVKGFDGIFNPDGDITRQDLAVILVRYAASIGFELPVNRDLPNFADKANVAGYALEAVEALYRAEILNGKSSERFDPTGLATRAEVAAVLQRFVELTDVA